MSREAYSSCAALDPAPGGFWYEIPGVPQLRAPGPRHQVPPYTKIQKTNLKLNIFVFRICLTNIGLHVSIVLWPQELPGGPGLPHQGLRPGHRLVQSTHNMPVPEN